MALPTGINFGDTELDFGFGSAAPSASSVNIPLNYPLGFKLGSHGRSVGDPVYLTVSSGSAPTGLATATVYYVSRVIGDGEFTVSATPGGAEINAPIWTSSMSAAGLVTVNRTAHGYAANTALRVNSSGALPRPLVSGTTYYVKTVVNANSFTLSTTAGGAEITYPTVTISNAKPAVVTWTAHALSVGNPLTFATTSALPSPLVAGTTYYVHTVQNANAFTITATVGGSAIQTTDAGLGTHYIRAGESGVDVVDLAANTGTYTINGYFPALCRSLYVGGAGNATLVMGNNDIVSFSNLRVGTFPVRARAVLTATATNLTAIF